MICIVLNIFKPCIKFENKWKYEISMTIKDYSFQ